MAHYPLYCGALHIHCVGLGLIVGLLFVIVHHYLLYIGRRYSHLYHHIILYCLVHCVRRFLPRRGLMFISDIHILGVYYSPIIYFFYFYAISRIWLHNLWYRSSLLGTSFCKKSYRGTFTTTLFLQGIIDLG